MRAFFIGQTYIDLTFLTDRLPVGDEKHVARAYAISFGGNAVTAAFCCAKLSIVPELITTVKTGKIISASPRPPPRTRFNTWATRQACPRSPISPPCGARSPACRRRAHPKKRCALFLRPRLAPA
jgi:hypothetical protein